MTFKQMDAYIRFLFSLYDDSHLAESNGYYLKDELSSKISRVINEMPSELRFMISNEYLSNNERNWWLDYYSHSSYYRIKNKAMRQFINCMNR